MWNVVELLGGEVEPIQSHLGGQTQGPARGLSRWLTLSLIALAVTTAGCGGGSSGGTSASTAAATTAAATPTAPQAAPSSSMAAAAENICGELNEKIAAENSKPLESFNALPDAIGRRVLVEQSALSELARLKPPAGIARAWVQIIGYRRTLEDNLVRVGEKLHSKEVNSMNAVNASTATVERELLAVGQRTGFKNCAQVG